jgi:DNA ligase (NAD+)
MTVEEKLELYKKAMKAYHQDDSPVMSDAEFDSLEKELKSYYKTHGLPDQTESVGYTPSKGFKTVRHAVPMLSLAKAYSREDVEDWLKQMNNFLGVK